MAGSAPRVSKMDLLAALGLVLVIEGLALAIFAASMPELLASMSQMQDHSLRLAGIAMAVLGGLGYLVIRGAF